MARKTVSKQPRFSDDEYSKRVYRSVLNWLRMAEISEPPYAADSRRRDAWLQEFWMLEPHLAGVVNAVVLIDSNRLWTLSGGRNQVIRYSSILHDAEGGAGWRTFIRKASLSYWTTDLGAVIEIGRDGRNGPLRALYHVDSARCRLTGDVDFPLEYEPPVGKPQRWRQDDFLRICSLPSSIETMFGLGYCAVSRCLELAKLLIAVYRYDQERLCARMPKGILFLDNITLQQWVDSLERREAELTARERQYYGGVQIIASGGAEQANARLVALSQLPDEFDRKIFTDQLMYGYALAFGYDPSEFWPVQYGALGRGTETEVQHRKATGKGGLDMALALQEALQNELPPTLQFEFEQRDEEGELRTAQLQRAKFEAIAVAYQAGLQFGAPLISRDEARSLLAESGVIPSEWTEAEEEAQIESEERRRARESEALQIAAREFPDEPIVRYVWPHGRLTTLFRDGRELYPFRIAVTRSVKRDKPSDDEDGEVLYDSGDWHITAADVRQAIDNAAHRLGEDYAAVLMAQVAGHDVGVLP